MNADWKLDLKMENFSSLSLEKNQRHVVIQTEILQTEPDKKSWALDDAENFVTSNQLIVFSPSRSNQIDYMNRNYLVQVLSPLEWVCNAPRYRNELGGKWDDKQSAIASTSAAINLACRRARVSSRYLLWGFQNFNMTLCGF